MPTLGQQIPKCLAPWMAYCSVGACLIACSVAQAQSPSDVEWATTSQVAGLTDVSAAPEVAIESRTPIQRTQSRSSDGSAAGDARTTSWAWAWLPVVIALALWWIVGRLRSGKLLDPSALPEGVIVSLGQRSIGSGRYIQLIRIGSRILVVTPTADGLRTLSEISDAPEVERLVSLCLRPNQGTTGIGSLFGGRPIHSPTTQKDAVREHSLPSATELDYGAKSARTRQTTSSRMEYVGLGDSMEDAR